MAEPRIKANPQTSQKTNSCGFSLVELLVALLFISFLMAGLASVFKASLSTFYTSGESLSSVRRNRMSIDLLDEDINAACMYLTDMTTPPQTLINNPPFYIKPNMPVEPVGYTFQDGDPKTTDELYFYMDEPLPFEGRLDITATGDQTTATEAVLNGTVISPDINKYTIECPTDAYAKQVAEQAARLDDEGGLVAIFKDFWEALHIKEASALGSKKVSITTGPTLHSEITGTGASGLPPRTKHLKDAGIVFVKPAQMVQYKIEMLPLHPDGTRIPCLVRRQELYSPVFKGDGSPQIITENVSGFKVYLSVDRGRTWAGLHTDPGTGFDGWDGAEGIRGQIDAQLKKGYGRQSFMIAGTRGDEHWFRSVPTLVRIDLTTRTAAKRAEYAKTNNLADAPALKYRTLTQSLIFVPRHFGLPMT